MNFTLDALTSAQNALNKLCDSVHQLRSQTDRTELSNEKLEKINTFRNSFESAISNDLQMPQALAVMYEMLKSNIPSPDKLDLLYEFDDVLGLGLRNVEDVKIPQNILDLVQKRQDAKEKKDFNGADTIRKEIEKLGYSIEDLADGFKIRKS